jgi:hypothetical protein
MEVSTILICTFVVLVGLQLCLIDTPTGKLEKSVTESNWTDSPWLRIIYSLCNLLGVIFVLGFLGYLVFTEHWWYLGVYLAGLVLARLVAFVLSLLLRPLYIMVNDIYGNVFVQRVVGIIIIIVGMLLFLVL